MLCGWANSPFLDGRSTDEQVGSACEEGTLKAPSQISDRKHGKKTQEEKQKINVIANHNKGWAVLKHS